MPNLMQVQKKELFSAAANVSFRALNVLMSRIIDDLDNLPDRVAQMAPEIINEKQVKKAIFLLATVIVCAFIKSTSKYTGADTLSKTYEEVLEKNETLIFRVLDFSIKLDYFDSFPLSELRDLVKECRNNKLVMTTLRHLVKYRLYMRPIEDYKIRQQICDIVGLSSITPILMEIKGAAS